MDEFLMGEDISIRFVLCPRTRTPFSVTAGFRVGPGEATASFRSPVLPAGLVCTLPFIPPVPLATSTCDESNEEQF
jgi:hypothetical protein